MVSVANVQCIEELGVDSNPLLKPYTGRPDPKGLQAVGLPLGDKIWC